MIVHEFNNGWGDGVELRQFERQLLTQYLAPWYKDQVASVIINSTWYNDQYHAEVRGWLARNPVERIALISFMDPAIPRPHWFSDLGCEVRSIGYYPGPDELDVWALIMHRYFDKVMDLGQVTDITTAFLCLNRKPHWHRRRAVSQLRHWGCVEQGVVTLGQTTGKAELALEHDVLASTIAPNPGPEQYGIVNDIMSLGPPEVWQRCFMNLVTETVYDVDREWFVSEKIYKPVVGMRPFLVYAPNGATSWIRHVGLEDYTGDFGDICDLDLTSPDNLAPFVKVLCDQPVSYLRKKYLDLWPKVCHNLDKFKHHVRQTQQRLDRAISP
jgi:hypothetical protein